MRSSVAASLCRFRGFDMIPRAYDGAPFPVEDLAAAKRWLWMFGHVSDWLDGDAGEIPLHARLVCDVFWVSPEALLRDLRKEWRAVYYSPPARFSGYRRGRR